MRASPHKPAQGPEPIEALGPAPAQGPAPVLADLLAPMAERLRADKASTRDATLRAEIEATLAILAELALFDRAGDL